MCQRQRTGTVLLAALSACTIAAVRAGLRFGEHRASSGGVAEYAGWTAITPEEFHRNHALPGVPAIFRGAALDWEPRTRWTDDFLTSRFGDLVVLTEDKLDDRSEGPQGMTVRKFVGKYRADGQDHAPIFPVQDGTDHSWVAALQRDPSSSRSDAASPAGPAPSADIAGSAGSAPGRRPWSRFLVSQTPDPMLASIPLFPLLRCSAYTGRPGAASDLHPAESSDQRGETSPLSKPPSSASGVPSGQGAPAAASAASGRNLLVESNLWLSSGNTASTWHEDADATLNCLLEGHKHWFMVEPRNRADVGMKDRGLSSAFSDVDVDDVLASRGSGKTALPNPDAEYTSFVAHGGDCVFLPARRPHHVRSYPGRNLALTTLFEAPPAWPAAEDEGNDCAFSDRGEAARELAARNVSLAAAGLRWRYSGNSLDDVSMGLEDVSVVAEQFAEAARGGEGDPGRLTLAELCGAVRAHVEQHLPDTGGSAVDEAALQRECRSVMKALGEAAGIGSGAPPSEVAVWLGRPVGQEGAGIPVDALAAVGRCGCPQAGRVVRKIEACLLSRCVAGQTATEEGGDDVEVEREEEDADEEDADEVEDDEEDADEEEEDDDEEEEGAEGGDELDYEQDEDDEWALLQEEDDVEGGDAPPSHQQRSRSDAGSHQQAPRHLAPGEAPPTGHMQPLGAHRPSDGAIATEEDGASVSPRELWRKYVKPRKPVILRGAAASWPAMTRWSDDASLIERYGWQEVRLEEKWEREDDAGLVRGERGFARDTIESFLSRYNRSDTNAYVVSQIPDAMRVDLPVPAFLACGPMADRLMELNLWISSGDTRSIVHRDPHNFANCLLAGAKNWTFIDPAFQSDVPMEPEAEHEAGGASQLNVRAVDLLQFPRFRRVRYRRVLQLPGDCIVSPGAYLHQVDSLPGRNVAVAFLFGRLEGLGTGEQLDAAFEDERRLRVASMP